MARRRARKFLVRRSKDNLSVVFGRRAGRIRPTPLGVLQAVEERTGRISLKNLEETEIRERDYFEIRNVNFNF